MSKEELVKFIEWLDKNGVYLFTWREGTNSQFGAEGEFDFLEKEEKEYWVNKYVNDAGIDL